MTAAADKRLRILSLQSENVLRLKAVFINPTGDVVQITGANDQGKTSVLNSIWLALQQVMVDAPSPLRKDTQKGRIRLNLGTTDGEIELIVTRTLGKGAGLTVETPDGNRLPKPQMVLDALIGSLSFDPLAFTRKQPREQYDELKRAVKVDLDFDKMDRENRTDFDRRTEINRQARSKRAEAEGMSIPPAPPAGAATDVRGVLDQIEQAATHNAAVERMRSSVAGLLAAADRADKSAAMHRQDAAAKREEAALLVKDAEDLEADAVRLQGEAEAKRQSAKDTAVPDPIDVTAARAQLDAAQGAEKLANERQSAIERRDACARDAARLEATAGELTAAMDARDQAKKAAISGAKLPVDGLGFGDGMVTYDGHPFQQASSAVQLKVSLGIAMAMNPRLRVIRIQDGSLLDEASMAFLERVAHEQDFQVWVERVDTSGKTGIFIQDGEVAAIDGKAQQRLPM